MAGLTLRDVAEVDLGKLGTAVAHWGKAVAHLKTLATNATSGLLAKSDSARWGGANATVTRAFVTKTAKEFTDAHAEAESIWKLLDDAHAELLKIQRSMKTAVDVDAPSMGVKIEDVGGGAVRWFFPHVRGDTDERTQEQREAAQALADRVAGLIAHATEIDGSVSRALAKSHGNDPYNFGHKSYESLDDAQQERAGELAKLGTEMTDKQFAEFNALMKYNARDHDFATAFYKGLGGPEKTLEFFGRMSLDGTQGDDKARLALTQELQRNMGTALGTASHDKAFTAEWGPEMRKLGTERIPMSKHDIGGPFGYQLLGGMMRYGDYDAKFLNPIAEHVAQLHQKDPELFAENKEVNSPFKNQFNPAGVNGAGYDPMTAMLEALGNSPDAAKQFFTDPPTAYNEDGTVNKGAAADLGKADDYPIDNYLDFFGTEKWESFGDVNSLGGKEGEAALGHMPDALGRALEAATLGYPAGHPDGDVVRDADNAAVMQQVMEKYGSDPGLLKHQEALTDSLGTMGAGYIDDINWALDKNDQDSVFAPGRNPEGRIDFSESLDGDGRSVARGFLSALGQHPDAYATLSAAEQVYTRSILEGQVGPDGKINEGGARSAVHIGAEVQGMLDQSRADQVEADSLKTHEDYEKAVEKRQGWIEMGAGVGVAAAVAFLPMAPAVGAAAVLIPLATDAGSTVVEGTFSQFVGGLSENSVEEHKEKTEEENRKEKTKIYSAGERLAEAPMEGFLDRNQLIVDSAFERDLVESMKLGYSIGNDRENQQGHDAETS